MDDLAGCVSAGQQHTCQPAAGGGIGDRDHEHAGAGFPEPAHWDPVNLAGQRVVIKEYGWLRSRRRRGTERVECLTAEPAGPTM